MTSKNIFKELGALDPQLILNAAPVQNKQSRVGSLRLKLVAVAACFCMLLAGAVCLVPMLIREDDPIDENRGNESTDASSAADKTPYYGFVWESNSGVFGIDTEEEMVVIESSLAVIQDDAYTSYLSSRVIDESYVGEKIGDVEVKVFWRNFLENKDTDIVYLDAEIFMIKKVSRDAAICLKYTEADDRYTTTHYYTFVNQELRVDTLGELYDAFCVSDYITLKDRVGIYEVVPREDHSSRKGYSLDSDALDILRRMLLSADGSAVELSEDTRSAVLADCTVQARFFISLPPASSLSSTVLVLDNGYIVYVFGATAYLFDIGKDTASDIVDFVYREGKLIQTAEDSVVSETAKAE